MDAQITLSQKRQTFNDMLLKQKDQLARVIPKHMNADRLLRIAQTAALTQPKLYECDLASIGQCLQKCSERGLEPDGYYAHLIPFRDNRNNRMVCTLIWDYKGLVELVLRSGKVSTISANVIYEDEARDPEKFFIEYGSNERIVHRPDIMAALQSQRNPVAVYAYATMKDGATKFDWMPWPEVMAIARRSKTYDKNNKNWRGGPWDTDTGEQSKKTILKRMTKLLQLSPEVSEVIQEDNETEFAAGDQPEIETMKAATPVIDDEPGTPQGPSSPFEEALKNDTPPKTETTEPEGTEAGPATTESEQPEGSEQSKVKQRLRRNKAELALYRTLLNEFETTERDPKNLFEFGLAIPLDRCFMNDLEMIRKALLEGDQEDAGEPSVDEAMDAEPETVKPDPEIPVTPEPVIDADKILAVSAIRQRIATYGVEGLPISEEDIIRFAVKNHEQPPESGKLEDLSKDTVVSIGFFFEKVYNWVQQNPGITF